MYFCVFSLELIILTFLDPNGVRNDPSIRNLAIIFKLSLINRNKSRFLSEIEYKTSEEMSRELLWYFCSYDVFNYPGVIYDPISGIDVDLKFHPKRYIF